MPPKSFLFISRFFSNSRLANDSKFDLELTGFVRAARRQRRYSDNTSFWRPERRGMPVVSLRQCCDCTKEIVKRSEYLDFLFLHARNGLRPKLRFDADEFRCELLETRSQTTESRCAIVEAHCLRQL